MSLSARALIVFWEVVLRPLELKFYKHRTSVVAYLVGPRC